MAVVTGTVATVAAGSASADATVASVGGTHLSAAAAAKQFDAIRELASAFIKSAAMAVVRESEIVDEFAAPIYAGLAMTMSPKSVVAGAAITKIGASGASPEAQTLLTKCYPTPTVEEQLAEGRDQIVVERNLLEEKVVDTGDKPTVRCVIEERVIDRKYLEHGHLTDLISEVRHGNIPTIRQIYLAFIDLMDLATFEVFRPMLQKLELEPARYRLRELSANLERKPLVPTLEREEKSRELIDRKVDERSWYKTDHVTERAKHTDVETKKETEIVTMNVSDKVTTEMSKEDVDKLKAEKRALATNMTIFNENPRAATIRIPPEKIAQDNRYSMAWMKETVYKRTTEYTTDETFNRYGVDLGGFLGKKIEMSDKKVTEQAQTTYSEYSSPSGEISLSDVNTNQQAMAKFASLQQTRSVKLDPVVVNRYIEPSEGVTFEDGWITYVPLGSIVDLGIKKDLGCKLTGWDWFWAGFDAASIALAVATFGSSTAISSAGAAAARVGAAVGKGVAKATVKASAKAAAKASAKAAVKASTKALPKAMIKQTGKVAFKNTGEMGLKAGRSAVGGIRGGAKVGAKNAVQTGRVAAIKNPGAAGAKAKPAVDVSKPVTTYKNIPKTGKWDGVPGDSKFHPDPKAVPSNPKVNPGGKTCEQILRENGLDGVPYVKGHPDFGKATKATVKIDRMVLDRQANFAKADSLLAQQVRNGKATAEIEKCLQKMGVDIKNVSKGDISRMRKQFGLTWHEHQNMKTMQLLPKELHGSLPHSGGISALRQEATDAATTTSTTKS